MIALEIAVKLHDSVIHSCIFNVNYVKTFATVLVSPNSDLFDVHSIHLFAIFS